MHVSVKSSVPLISISHSVQAWSVWFVMNLNAISNLGGQSINQRTGACGEVTNPTLRRNLERFVKINVLQHCFKHFNNKWVYLSAFFMETKVQLYVMFHLLAQIFSDSSST